MGNDLVLGMDIGVSSVGWGIINRTSGDIVASAVRKFEEVDRNANEKRREFRGSERLSRRRKHRLKRTKDLFDAYRIPHDAIQTVDPYEARLKGLSLPLSELELATALYHLAKRRGTTIDTPEDDDAAADSLSTKDQLKQNAKELKDKYIVEIQYERLKEDKSIRNHKNRFRTEDYIREANTLLDTQRRAHEKIDEAFVNNYLEILTSRREYYEGPGSQKSPTPYGRYFYDEDGELRYEGMIEKMRGKGTYFKDQPRMAKRSYTAELFNVLNELNNVRYPDEETGEMKALTQEEKQQLINNYLKKNKRITLNAIAKLVNLSNKLEIKGAPINMKKNKAEFSELKRFKELKKQLKDVDVPDYFFENVPCLDSIADILTSEKGMTRREEQLSDLFETHYADPLTNVVETLKNDTFFKEYHSLSKQGIDLIMTELWETEKNQMQLFTEYGLGADRISQLQSGTEIQFDGEAILSSVAQRAHREAVKITNELRKTYGEFDYVVIEMAREKNEKEKKDRYSAFQKQHGKFERRMAELLGVEELKDLRLNGKQMTALKLLDKQDFKCIYSGKGILPDQIVNDFHLFEIDHIIPISYSYDDSQQNKVLCYVDENQKKGQKTPFHYFQSGEASRSFEEFEQECTNLFNSKRISKKKLNYLLEKRDVQRDEEVQTSFINRNLVDTRYAMGSFSNNLRAFYQNNQIPTRVLSVRGSFTHALRKRARLNKDRDESHAHHGIDALIVAAIGVMPLLNQFKNLTMDPQGVAVDKNTGEILSKEDIFSESSLRFLHTLRNYEPFINYSHKVDRKPNRSMTNQTIYSTRKKNDEEYRVRKIKNIYTLDKQAFKTLKKKIDQHPENFLMAQHDPKTRALILKVMEEHDHADNPFQDFYTNHGYILKDGKVPVKGLKYLHDKVGVYKDITHHYPNAKNKVILKSQKSIRIDVYQNEQGKYKYLGVPYNWFKKEKNAYVLDMDAYNAEKKAPYKRIDGKYTFLYSFYKNERISYDKEEKRTNPVTGEKEKQQVHYDKLFRGDSSPRDNKLEVEDISFQTKKQQIISVGSLKNIKKYTVDLLGNEYLIEQETFTDRVPIIR